MDISVFKKNITRYASHYNPTALFGKIKKVAKKVGIKAIYYVLILYYASFDKNIPLKDRLLIGAALGYFILPFDIIPDTIFGGFSDDMAAIVYVLKHVWKHLSPDTFDKAHKKLREWFGDDPTVKVDNLCPQA